LFVFAIVVFYAPEMGGYFLEHANFIPADPLTTPEHIAPVWYFTPFYTVLRAVPDPFFGVVAMGLAVGILFVLPWIDRNPIRSVRYRSRLHKLNLILFAIVFIILGILGTKPATPLAGEMAVRFAEVYFLFFIVLWFSSKTRSAKFSIGLFVALMILISIYDLSRVDADKVMLVFAAWLIPAVYLAVMLVLPIFTNLNAEQPVPERVTS
jgi:ubiquinol-cytochrome c reductase cytochrome b subunit